MIGSVSISNWRSIDDLEMPLSPLTSLVGANGVGKTAVLDAIDFVLGTRWPGMNYLNIPRDFHEFDTSRSMKIRCSFNPPLEFVDAMGTKYPIKHLQYRCQPYKIKSGKSRPGDLHDDFQPLSLKGDLLKVATSPARANPRRAPEFGPLYRVGTELREQARVLTISDRRSVAAHASGRRGSALNTLLAEVRKDFTRDVGGTRSSFAERYEDALTALRTSAVQELEQTIGETAKQMLGFLGSREASRLEIAFGFGDPADPFGSLCLMCREGKLELPAELMGLGIQSAIVVGVFEALRRQRATVGTVLIEEPEIYLHPQAQRYFHSLLVDLVSAELCQVIYTTHSPIFADMTRFSGVRLLQKDGSSTSSTWISERADLDFLQDQLNRQKLSQYMDPTASEALFAKRVLLVEGHGDYLAARLVARKLDIDLDAEGLSVVPCGGKNAIPFFARMCNALGIPAFVLHDSDLYQTPGRAEIPRWQQQETARAVKDNAAIVAALADDSRLFVVEPTLEAVLGVGHSAADKPMKVVEQLESRPLAEVPAPLLGAVRALVAEPSVDTATGES